MVKSKLADLDALDQGAAVREQAKTATTETKSKLLNKFPVALENRHKKLKESGTTTLNLSQYILEAVREKLERDEQ